MFAKKQLAFQSSVPLRQQPQNSKHLNHQFFLLVRDQHYEQAYTLGQKILQISPDNPAVERFCHFIRDNQKELGKMLEEQEWESDEEDEYEQDDEDDEEDDESEQDEKSETTFRSSSQSVSSKASSVSSKSSSSKQVLQPKPLQKTANKQNAYKWEHNCKNPNCPNKNKPHKYHQ